MNKAINAYKAQQAVIQNARASRQQQQAAIQNASASRQQQQAAIPPSDTPVLERFDTLLKELHKSRSAARGRRTAGYAAKTNNATRTGLRGRGAAFNQREAATSTESTPAQEVITQSPSINQPVEPAPEEPTQTEAPSAPQDTAKTYYYPGWNGTSLISWNSGNGGFS